MASDLCNRPRALQKALPGHPGNLTKQQAEALYQLVVLLQKDGALHDPEQDPPTHQETQLL